jgi:hypothetical protein
MDAPYIAAAVSLSTPFHPMGEKQLDRAAVLKHKGDYEPDDQRRARPHPPLALRG